MLQRVMPDLMGLKNILVLNDEAHHCYREKPKAAEEELEDLKGEDKEEAKKNQKAAAFSRYENGKTKPPLALEGPQFRPKHV